jgi:hypothetical protein
VCVTCLLEDLVGGLKKIVTGVHAAYAALSWRVISAVRSIEWSLADRDRTRSWYRMQPYLSMTFKRRECSGRHSRGRREGSRNRAGQTSTVTRLSVPTRVASPQKVHKTNREITTQKNRSLTSRTDLPFL